jgi:SnoaL-like domain
MAKAKKSVEERLQKVEDRLEILNLIAAHPPGADSGAGDFAASYWIEDGVFDRGAGLTGNKGKAAMAAGLQAPGFRQAMREGIAHFSGLPHIELNGDQATVTSYLQIVMPNPQGEPVELSSHGNSKGFRIHRMTVNRWDLVRTEEGWRIAKRRIRLLDTTDDGRALLREMTQPAQT